MTSVHLLSINFCRLQYPSAGAYATFNGIERVGLLTVHLDNPFIPPAILCTYSRRDATIAGGQHSILLLYRDLGGHRNRNRNRVILVTPHL